MEVRGKCESVRASIKRRKTGKQENNSECQRKIKKISAYSTPSILEHIFTMNLGCDYMILLTLGSVYEGQKIND